VIKIVSRKSLGTQTVYDIGVERDHNFILATGLVASNCFNKSHSMAYAYVTYQTAYLKANYPVEYMAALLTANSGDQDKVQKYIANCLKMSIEIEPPDINRSEVTFTPLPKYFTGAKVDKILFGMSAVKNLGENAIDNILKVRKAGGEFKSLADFCERVDLKAVNSRASEALIQCGAFDHLNPNRNQLMHDLDGVVKWAQDRKKEQESGQGNLLDLLGMNFSNGKNSYDSVPKHKPVADFPSQEKLRLEKELLGFYVSDHPLKSVLLANPIEEVITIEQLADFKKKEVKVMVMVSAIKLVTTKKGERMAILQVEDLTSQVEAVVFPKTYEKINTLIVENALLLISGKIDKRDDGMQIIVEDAKLMTLEQNVQSEEEDNSIESSQIFRQQIEAENSLPPSYITEVVKQVIATEMVLLKLTTQEVQNNEKLNSLKAILEEHSDRKDNIKVQVNAIVAGEYCRQMVRFGSQFWVENAEETVKRLQSSGFIAEVSKAD